MSSSDIAIRVNNLSKCYEIYENPRDRLKQFVMPLIRRLLGKKQKQYFREFWALKDVSFEIKKGETVGIIGRNGSGKSTLLQMICGTLTPTIGSIQTIGRVAALLELGSGFNPEFSGRENVYMNASVLGLKKEEIDARFDEIVSFADIGDFVERPVKTYSSGMMVRLAFAVIAHVDADILVIDEALAVGDAFFTQKCMRFLRKFMENGTVLFVSHDTGAVVNFCQRAIWLSKGVAKYQGKPKAAAEKYLAELYESQHIENTMMADVQNIENYSIMEHSRDMRLDFINTTSFRNDIEIFKFTPSATSFGKGGGNITLVQLLDCNNKPLSWVVGGEIVILKVHCKINLDMQGPIVGFFVNDRLGQNLFGDNTCITYPQYSLSVASGKVLVVSFKFQMPILPIGDYTVTVAFAEGSQLNHVQHHWVHDAVVLKSHSSSVSSGLVGIPMNKIEMIVT